MDTQILKEIKNLSESLHDSKVYEDFIGKVKKSDSPYVKIGVLGGANAGKSMLINLLLPDTAVLSESSMSCVTDISIFPAQENYYVLNGKKNPIRDSEKVKFDNEKIVEIYLKNEWLIENNISIGEYHDFAITSDSTDQDIANYFCNIYICIYILDALMPLSKQDAAVLSALNKFEIPTLVMVSKFEKLTEDEQKDVKQYLNDRLTKYASIKYSGEELFKPLPQQSALAKSFIESAAKDTDFSRQKTGYEALFLLDIIVKLRALCQLKLDENIKNKQKIADNTRKKYEKISASETEWLRIETALAERRQKTGNKIRERLDGKGDDMLRRLSHDIEVSNDIKQYWDKELTYRLDDMLRIETQNLLQIINQDIVNNLKWLQDEVIKNFKFQTSMLPFVSVSLDNKEVTLENLKLADNQKLRIVTRVGTAATVICAGVAVATAGIGGAVMAVGILSGIGAEFFMKHKTKEARQQVLDVLPRIIEKAKLEYVSGVSDSLKKAYDEVLANLKQLNQNWKEKAIKEIHEEEIIASHNLLSDQWDECMNRINELAKGIIPKVT